MPSLMKRSPRVYFLPLLFLLMLFLFPAGLGAEEAGSLDDELWLQDDISVEPLVSLRLRAQGDYSRDLQRSQTDLILPARALLGSQINLGSNFAGRAVLGASSNLGRLEDSRFYVDEVFLDATMQVGPGLARWRLGRQSLNWGHGRIVSDEDFFQQAPRLDALRLSLALSTVELDLFAARLGQMAAHSTRNLLSELGEKDLVTAARLSWDPGRTIQIAAESSVWLAEAVGADSLAVEGNQAKRSQLASLGFDIDMRPLSLLRLTSAGTLQFGEHRGLRHLAYDLAAMTQVKAFWSPQESLELGYDLSSGDGQALDNRSSGFINPLGMRHGRYGLGDFVGAENATDLWMRLQSQRTLGRLALTVHRLSLFDPRGAWIDATAQTLAPRSTAKHALLGYELDLLVEAALRKPLFLGLTYAMFVPGQAAQECLGNEVAHRLLVEFNLRY